MPKNYLSKPFFNCLIQGLLGNFAISGLAYLLTSAFGGPKIYIESSSALYAAILLFGLFVILIFASILALVKNRGQNQESAFLGPFRYIRHPFFSGIIFLLNPAIAILLKSWLMIFAIIPVYFIWSACAKNADKKLKEKLNDQYFETDEINLLFPDIRQINKIIFYGATALAIFIFSFIVMNFSAVYLRWVNYEKHQGITFDEASAKQSSPAYFQQMFARNANISQQLPIQEDTAPLAANVNKADYSDKLNSIFISKIEVNAPLVFPTGTSQKELNDALNKGVIIYPGSALPGQDGEVFLSGHSSIYPWVKTQYGLVFTLLDKLQPGDTVSLIYEHTQYDYQITGKEVLYPRDLVLSDTKKPTIALMTCWPIGTTLKRLVVRGELIK